MTVFGMFVLDDSVSVDFAEVDIKKSIPDYNTAIVSSRSYKTYFVLRFVEKFTFGMKFDGRETFCLFFLTEESHMLLIRIEDSIVID
jgi:hypothetical protein